MHILRESNRFAMALVVLLATVATLLAAPGRAEAAVNSSAEAEFVELINESRTAQGLKPLRVASDLVSAARSHSRDMAAQDRLHHNPNLGSDVSNWKRLSENVGFGQTVPSLHDAFMNSTGHRRNILDDNVTEVGIGVYMDGRNLWVTEVFRLPKVANVEKSGSGNNIGDGVPFWGDWDGDGVATPGRWRNGVFHLSNQRDGGGELVVLPYGRSTDKPVVGDWDGDGIDTIGVVRGNKWILRNEYRSGADDIVMHYGRDTDKPVVGDWDGNGTDTLGVVRGNKWILRNVYRSGADDIVMRYGRDTDLPVVGDWDGNGTDTLGVVRGNRWILRNVYRSGADDIVMEYGRSTDEMVTGDFNADGRDTLGVVRDEKWILRYEYRRGADLVFNY